MRDVHRRIAKSNNRQLVEALRTELRLEALATLRHRIVRNDVFARNAMPVIKGIARIYVIRRKHQPHAVPADI